MRADEFLLRLAVTEACILPPLILVLPGLLDRSTRFRERLLRSAREMEAENERLYGGSG